ncbi:MAG: HDOD domain-containing protein [Pseudomonadota bacterium]
MTPLTMDEVLANIQRMPSLPVIVGDLIKALDDEETGIDQLAEGIAKDQTLAARALRVANSPFYGTQHKVASIHDAIVILGFRAVGSLVTAASITGYFAPPPGVAFNLASFWRHGIGTALCARALARDAGVDPESAFTAGLLHDIGALVLLTAEPKRYAKVLAHRERNDSFRIEAEREVLGVDHAQAGEALASRWRFPSEIVRAVALHHAPDAGLADVVHAADVLAHALDLAGDPLARVPTPCPGAWRRLGLDRDRLRAMFGGIEQEHAGYCALLV